MPQPDLSSGTVRKPLPADRFVVHDTNVEMRWDAVDADTALTPQSDLFVRNHTETPLVDADAWALRIFGDGLLVPRDADNPVTVSYDDLRSLPATRLTTTLECTGNGRSFFTRQQGQQVPGTPWEMGGVAAVTWEGVRLAEVFDRIGVRREAVSVMATGLDPSYVCDQGIDRGPVRRPFPVAKALDDALLVWGVNGEPLLPDHGFPVRLVLPGWVGIANIKWLGSLEVSTTQLASPWSTEWYRMSGGDHPADAPPLTTSPVRSAWELARDASLPAGRPLELTGRSWSGAGPITRVDVSVDGGRTWLPAELGERSGWTRWRFTWADPPRGAHVLMARAIDVAGRRQPLQTPFNAEGYCFDAVVRHPVTVA